MASVRAPSSPWFADPSGSSRPGPTRPNAAPIGLPVGAAPLVDPASTGPLPGRTGAAFWLPFPFAARHAARQGRGTGQGRAASIPVPVSHGRPRRGGGMVAILRGWPYGVVHGPERARAGSREGRTMVPAAGYRRRQASGSSPWACLPCPRLSARCTWHGPGQAFGAGRPAGPGWRRGLAGKELDAGAGGGRRGSVAGPAQGTGRSSPAPGPRGPAKGKAPPGAGPFRGTRGVPEGWIGAISRRS
jgi:hypothetical protein